MSDISNVRLKECKVKLTRLTKEEIEKHTGKTFEEAEKIADLIDDNKPKLFVRKDVIMDIKTTQDTEEGTSNTGHEIIPDIITPQNIQCDDINNEEINGTQAENNVYVGPNDFMPMIYQQYDMDTVTEEIDYNYRPEMNYIPDMIIKQEIQDDSYGTYTPQVAGTSQLMIKQEVVDESYNYNNMFSAQGSHNMYSEYYVPNILSNQPTENFGMQNINPETSNPYVTIKQEVFDEGNIEVYTDVLMPSADPVYEDGTPW
ncbi:unnamed protein product [Macrosiphum euphorbiae]|uniref:Uncharacterized protein n=1 Tax=Macrosiphum euphorbiae TaxID=13131 RepID=A0AAV0WBT6_9HEMI|nr:unnamed protein product [Macrosiphum euphorbiae]